MINIVEKGNSPLYWASTAVLDWSGSSVQRWIAFFRLYLSFPLDGIGLTLPPLHPSRTGRHAASVAPFVGLDSSFMPLRWTFAALRCRDLAGSSLAMSFSVFLFTPARISLCISSDDGLTSSVFQGLAANHVQVVVLVTSGCCCPSAADEWYSPKRPSSTVAIQHSSGSSVQRWVTFFQQCYK